MPKTRSHDRVRQARKAQKLTQYAQRVWGVQGLSGHELIDAVIAKTEEFFRSVGTPTKLSDCGLTPADCQVIVKQFEERNSKLGEHEAIGLQEVEGILALCA